MDDVTPPRGCLEGSASTGVHRAPVTGSFLKFSSPPGVAQERPPEKALTQRAETEPTEAGINLQTLQLTAGDGRVGG